MGKNKRRSAKIGLPPGALVHLGERKIEHATLTLLEYGSDDLAERCLASAQDVHAVPAQLPVRWINVHGLHEPEVMAAIGSQFGLHPLVVEDILNTDQRPKVDDYGDYLFIVARFFDFDTASKTLTSEQVSLVLGKDYVLSFQERPSGHFDPVRERLRQSHGLIRRLGADYLLYALLDVVVDRYFSVLEEIGEESERIEEDLLRKPTTAVLQRLHQLKRETLALRRAVWPLREVVNSLTRTEGRFFKPETQPYLRDIYDHTVHVIESLEAIRDLVAGLLDVYLSTTSNRVNKEVRALTVVAVVFMPATLISGIFGMNFKTMPLLENPWGFLEALGLMAVIASTVALILWRRK